MSGSMRSCCKQMGSLCCTWPDRMTSHQQAGIPHPLGTRVGRRSHPSKHRSCTVCRHRCDSRRSRHRSLRCMWTWNKHRHGPPAECREDRSGNQACPIRWSNNPNYLRSRLLFKSRNTHIRHNLKIYSFLQYNEIVSSLITPYTMNVSWTIWSVCIARPFPSVSGPVYFVFLLIVMGLILHSDRKEIKWNIVMYFCQPSNRCKFRGVCYYCTGQIMSYIQQRICRHTFRGHVDGLGILPTEVGVSRQLNDSDVIGESLTTVFSPVRVLDDLGETERLWVALWLGDTIVHTQNNTVGAKRETYTMGGGHQPSAADYGSTTTVAAVYLQRGLPRPFSSISHILTPYDVGQTGTGQREAEGD